MGIGSVGTKKMSSMKNAGMPVGHPCKGCDVGTAGRRLRDGDPGIRGFSPGVADGTDEEVLPGLRRLILPAGLRF